jgi:small-conductance mechanosensitive channel
MTAHLEPNRMPVPPPSVVRNGRAPARGRAVHAPSARAFVAKIMFSAFVIVMAATLMATAPRTVTIPVAIVLGTGLVASTLTVTGDQWLARQGRRRASKRRSAPPPATGQHPGLAVRDDYDPDAPRRVAGWGALAAMSVSLLVVALVVGQRLGAVLAAAGLAGLAVFRLAAMYGGWVRRSAILAESPSGPDNGAGTPKLGSARIVAMAPC